MAAGRPSRSVALWSLPLLSDRDIPLALDISPSGWQKIKSNGDGPRLFSIGKRVFCLTADLRAWIEHLAADAHPGVQHPHSVDAVPATSQ